jgi:two-component system, NarL family, response regulator LiaR
LDTIRTLVVDDQNIVRQGTMAILSLQRDIKVVGDAAHGSEAVSLVEKARPDVILMDLPLQMQDGLETISKIKEIMPDARILVLASSAQSERVYQVIRLGALGYMLKDSTGEQLVEALRNVAQGKAALPPAIALRVIHEIDELSRLSNTLDQLTPKETETLRQMAKGLSNKDIAGELFVDERTVAKHVSSILKKLHLTNRTQAALYALHEQIMVGSDKRTE